MGRIERIACVAALLALGVACGERETSFSKGSGNEGLVEGSAIMELSADELVFADAPVGSARSIDLVVGNSGDADLTIFSGRIYDDESFVYYADEDAVEDAVVVPGQEISIPIVVTLEEAEPATAVFRLDTNDRERPVFDVALLTTPEGWVGDTGAR